MQTTNDTQPDTAPPTQPTRRRELDAMGALVVLGLVFFHSAMIFDRLDWFIQNEPSSDLALLFTGFGSMWGMPLMFIIAGMAIYYSLRKREPGEFVRERLRRLLLPFITGLLIIAPPQVYCELKGDPAYHETFVQFYPSFFDVRLTLDFPLFIRGARFDYAHLWFLLCLLAFTLLLLPLWLYLQGAAGQRRVERLATFCTRRWAIFALALPIAIIETALGTSKGSGNWNPLSYAPLLVYGFLFASDARLGRALQRHWKSALTLAILALLGWFTGVGILVEVFDVEPSTDYDLGSVLVRFLKGFASWFWIVAIMGLAGRASQPGKPAPQTREPTRMDRLALYANQAQLPFYVLHQMPIVVIGFYVIQWDINALAKYLIICLSTLAVTLALYDLGVRRTRLTRFLFGMKSKPGPFRQ